MGVKIAAGNCLHWSLPSLPHCSSPQTLASTVPSERRGTDGFNRSLFCSIGQQSPFLGSAKLSRRQSLEDLRRTGWRSKGQSFRRAFSASVGGFAEDDKSDEEFVRRLQELALELQHNCDNVEHLPDSRAQGIENTCSPSSDSAYVSFVRSEFSPSAEPPWSMTPPELPEWVNGDEIAPASVEMKANRVDLPLSLRIIKRKKRWEEGLKEASESACCSIKKAFSSMVFIVRELQSYTLQMREVLFYENLQGILARVQGEMNASFVWLFQQIFSCTPTLMVCVMLLLANFTVYSIGHNSAIAAVSPNPPVVVEQHYEQSQHQNPRFDTSSIKSFSVGRTASVGGGGGGGGKVRPVAGATGDGQFDGSHSTFSQTIVPADGISKIGSEGSETVMEETAVWNRIVEEASRMQASSRDEALMHSDTLQQLVSPVTVELEPDDYADYLQTELMYHKAMSQDPDNVLLLSNFAQFLFLVLHDHDR